jgi:hypothetical protein
MTWCKQGHTRRLEAALATAERELNALIAASPASPPPMATPVNNRHGMAGEAAKRVNQRDSLLAQLAPGQRALQQVRDARRLLRVHPPSRPDFE